MIVRIIYNYDYTKLPQRLKSNIKVYFAIISKRKHIKEINCKVFHYWKKKYQTKS